MQPYQLNENFLTFHGPVSGMQVKGCTVLYEAAHIILTRPVKAGALKSWAMRLAARAGKNKAKVALARKLAVILHRMLVDGTPFVADKAAMAKG